MDSEGWAAGHARHWIGNCGGVKGCYSVEVQCPVVIFAAGEEKKLLELYNSVK